MGKEPTKAGNRGKYVALHKRAFGTKNKRINGFEKKVRRFQGLAQILFSITINLSWVQYNDVLLEVSKMFSFSSG
ncbi:hypothetical protein [Porphyromonas gingivicanis]|uniref:hypothetical protein n=1 Tax=Porphyromonas gingivicanis TaxID=266762 RepID=UPI000470571B|nr:hypothetical protein [Porphyromonas gingivicanis]